MARWFPVMLSASVVVGLSACNKKPSVSEGGGFEESEASEADSSDPETESGDPAQPECMLEWEPAASDECQPGGAPVEAPADTSGSTLVGSTLAILIGSDDALHILATDHYESDTTGASLAHFQHHVRRNGVWEQPIVSGSQDGLSPILTETGTGALMATDYHRAVIWEQGPPTVTYDAGVDRHMWGVAGEQNGPGTWLLRVLRPEWALLADYGSGCVAERWFQQSDCGEEIDSWEIALATDPTNAPVFAYLSADKLHISRPTYAPNTFVVPAPVLLEYLEDFEIDDVGRMHVCGGSPFSIPKNTHTTLYAVGTDEGPWQTVEFDREVLGECRLAVAPDGSAWIAGGHFYPGSRVAHVVDGVAEVMLIEFETDVSFSADVDVDSQGRPWVTIWDQDGFSLAHLADGAWTIEPLPF